MPFTARHLLAASALFCTTAFGSGCDLLEAIDGGGSTLVQLMVTHHATPEDGIFPDLRVGEFRSFENDMGWQVNLRAAFVTTTGASLNECAGGNVAFDNFWGSLPENLNDDDLALQSFAAVEVEANEFCSMTVQYGPYVAEGQEAMAHNMGEHRDAVMGTTFYLKGTAIMGDVTVPFEVTSTASASARVDLSHAMAGGPLTIDADEAFPVDLTLSKTYDRFFDGIDFNAFDEADIEQNVLAMLEEDSRVAVGTRVVAE